MISLIDQDIKDNTPSLGCMNNNLPLNLVSRRSFTKSVALIFIKNIL